MIDIEKRMIIRNKAKELVEAIDKMDYSSEDIKVRKEALLKADHGLWKACQGFDTDKYVVLDREKLIRKMVATIEFHHDLAKMNYLYSDREQIVEKAIKELENGN